VGEAVKGGQLIANQRQEWMGIRTTSKKAGSPSKIEDDMGKGVGLERISPDV
jgi:hypothetical protein